MNAELPAAPVAPASIEAFVFRFPVETPVQTSFGIMHDRPALFIRATDEDGSTGWGEVWCNFPAVGAEHRARLIESALMPRLLGKKFLSPADAYDDLTKAMAVLAIQAGEPGPIAQAIAGIDIALWDLAARKLRMPLWRLFGGTSPVIRLYGSGLNPDAPEKLAVRRQAEGHRAFKLKVGFGAERDLRNLRALRDALGGDAGLMVDANQAWTLDGAQEMLPRLEPFDLHWLEEPIRADRPWEEWQALAASTKMPLAAGENLLGDAQFDQAIASGALGVMQPDIAKWGGFTACFGVARRIRAAGIRYCPHWLGGGIGLLASAHLLAAAGGDGWLEVDANANPLRDELSGPIRHPANGTCTLTDAPGLGELPDPTRLSSLSLWLRRA